DDGFRIKRFVEKPGRATSEQYLADGGYSWNSGMFLFSAKRYLEELGIHAPAILQAAREAYAGAGADLDFIRVDAEAFAASPSDSIDYAVMENTDRAAVVPVSCGWSDIGSWSSLWSVAERDEADNRTEGDVIAVDTRGSFVRAAAHRLVATVGWTTWSSSTRPTPRLSRARTGCRRSRRWSIGSRPMAGPSTCPTARCIDRGEATIRSASANASRSSA